MTESKKEPMIDKSNRPSPIDYDAPLAGMKLRDLISALSTHASVQITSHYEFFKPEHVKPEFYKPEAYKPEYFKPDYFKPEFVKPDFAKELKEKEAIGQDIDPIENLANRVAAILKERP
jgi:hypothetical protein